MLYTVPSWSKNFAPDTFTEANCLAVTAISYVLSSALQNNIYKKLFHPGVTHMLYYIRSKNLPFSTIYIKRPVFGCKNFAQIKPFFVRRELAQENEAISVEYLLAV